MEQLPARVAKLERKPRRATKRSRIRGQVRRRDILDLSNINVDYTVTFDSDDPTSGVVTFTATGATVAFDGIEEVQTEGDFAPEGEFFIL